MPSSERSNKGSGVAEVIPKANLQLAWIIPAVDITRRCYIFISWKPIFFYHKLRAPGEAMAIPKAHPLPVACCFGVAR